MALLHFFPLPGLRRLAAPASVSLIVAGDCPAAGAPHSAATGLGVSGLIHPSFISIHAVRIPLREGLGHVLYLLDYDSMIRGCAQTVFANIMREFLIRDNLLGDVKNYCHERNRSGELPCKRLAPPLWRSPRLASQGISRRIRPHLWSNQARRRGDSRLRLSP